MPLYEYECPECGRFERIQKFSDAILTQCPTCDRDVEKLLSAPAIQFKGSGWYITDYARKGQDGGNGNKADGASSKEGASDKKDDSSKKASSDSSKSGDSAKKSDAGAAKSTSSDSSKSSSSTTSK